MNDSFDPNATLTQRATVYVKRMVMPNGRRWSDQLPAIGKFLIYLAIAYVIVTTGQLHGVL